MMTVKIPSEPWSTERILTVLPARIDGEFLPMFTFTSASGRREKKEHGTKEREGRGCNHTNSIQPNPNATTQQPR
jgi:hypothetical protein